MTVVHLSCFSCWCWFVSKRLTFCTELVYKVQKTADFIIIISHSFYIALFSTLEQTHCAHVTCDSEWVTVSFYSAYYLCPRKWCTDSALWLLHGWCHVKCCRFGANSVYTIQPCTSLQCHFTESHIGRVYACLAVTCHLHFWQKNWDLLRATAVTRGWNGYRNKSHF